MDLDALHPTFGARTFDIDLSKPRNSEQQRRLALEIHACQVLLIKNQSLSCAAFSRLGSHLGDAEPHFLDHLRLQTAPEILRISNVYKDGKPLGIHEGAAFWHTDVAYRDPPNFLTMMYALETPAAYCPTWFADMHGAYDALSNDLKDRLEGLVAEHHYGNREDMDEDSPYSAQRLTSEQKRAVRTVLQPLVRTHPITGRKALYGVAGSSFGIVGMAQDRALELLHELRDHATRDEFTLPVDLEPGDVVIHDNFSTLHKGPMLPPATHFSTHRMLWRISTTGLAPVLRPTAPPAEFPLEVGAAL